MVAHPLGEQDGLLDPRPLPVPVGLNARGHLGQLSVLLVGEILVQGGRPLFLCHLLADAEGRVGAGGGVVVTAGHRTVNAGPADLLAHARPSLAPSRRMSSLTASTASFTDRVTSSDSFWSKPAFSRSWFQIT